MGKTSKPLILRIHPSLIHFEAWAKYAAQGYTILNDPNDCDLHLGPTSWYMTPAHEKYVDVAIKAGREIRYGKGGKNEE